MRRVHRLTKASLTEWLIEQYWFAAIYAKTYLKHIHVAIILRRGKVLCTATNFLGTRTKGCGYDHFSIHAERAALKKVGNTSLLSGATLVVVRIAKGTREMVDSEPCHTCRCHLEKCVREYGLRRVYYS